jgi:hypothetical protein
MGSKPVYEICFKDIYDGDGTVKETITIYNHPDGTLYHGDSTKCNICNIEFPHGEYNKKVVYHFEQSAKHRKNKQKNNINL